VEYFRSDSLPEFKVVNARLQSLGATPLTEEEYEGMKINNEAKKEKLKNILIEMNYYQFFIKNVVEKIQKQVVEGLSEDEHYIYDKSAEMVKSVSEISQLASEEEKKKKEEDVKLKEKEIKDFAERKNIDIEQLSNKIERQKKERFELLKKQHQVDFDQEKEKIAQQVEAQLTIDPIKID